MAGLGGLHVSSPDADNQADTGQNATRREHSGSVTASREETSGQDPAHLILGIDEVGRGPWAGPLVVGAVILGDHFEALPEYQELNDSKKLTDKKRQHLSPVILEHAAATGLGWVPAEELDRLGLSRALHLAARRAVKQILALRPVVEFHEIIIDGTINLLRGTALESRVTLLPKADSLVKEVSAASIIAKVARDTYMANLAPTYPAYGFEAHVGYGTKKHREALEQYGPTREHRQSFRPVAEITAKFQVTTHTDPPEPLDPSTNYAHGHAAEQTVTKYLTTHGHQIIATNHRTKSSEIDIISLQGSNLYFTEVKSRQDPTAGSPLEMITPKKLQQMHRSAEAFLAAHPELQAFQPLLAAASVVSGKFQDWLILA